MKPKQHIPSLSADAQAWLDEVSQAFRLTPVQRKLALLAARQLDQIAAAREEIAARGLLVKGAGRTKKANPMIAVERNSALLFQRLIRQMGLPTSDARDGVLPHREKRGRPNGGARTYF